jgi:hypothetical protein
MFALDEDDATAISAAFDKGARGLRRWSCNTGSQR